jgi:hypothetical protein
LGGKSDKGEEIKENVKETEKRQNIKWTLKVKGYGNINVKLAKKVKKSKCSASS